MIAHVWPGIHPSNINRELRHYTDGVTRMAWWSPQQQCEFQHTHRASRIPSRIQEEQEQEQEEEQEEEEEEEERITRIREHRAVLEAIP
jgi:hypothetical protein